MADRDKWGCRVDVLVGFASSHGSTRGVAERIAGRLGEQGHRAEVRSLDQSPEPGRYDAAVLGSAIHNGSWLPQATEYVRRNRELLAARPVWLFSVATLGDEASMLGPTVTRLFRRFGAQPKELADFRETIHPRGHHGFVGAVGREDYPWIGRLIYRAMGGRYGDHRDWREIDAWADAIAHGLAPAQ
jgi:menaquinone-dependent protoporphyrinogen oxidase